MIERYNEKRSSPRLRMKVAVRYEVRGKGIFDRGITENISHGGIAFSAAEYLAPDTLLMLDINLLNRTIKPISKVAWASPVPYSDKNRIGVEFLELDPKESEYLADFLDMQDVLFTSK